MKNITPQFNMVVTISRVFSMAASWCMNTQWFIEKIVPTICRYAQLHVVEFGVGQLIIDKVNFWANHFIVLVCLNNILSNLTVLAGLARKSVTEVKS